jgi:hypothetical protein
MNEWRIKASKPVDEAHGPTSKYVQRACHDILPWITSVSLGRKRHAAYETA